ncbi:hypothetical protein GCM10009823_30400 [Brevibacterium salitolerans]|uniref:Uncharacterized protein n=1 Tax=Brevibacterium salitolerans TaxID=1403566 RepID=A0ABN2X4L7_9MICO
MWVAAVGEPAGEPDGEESRTWPLPEETRSVRAEGGPDSVCAGVLSVVPSRSLMLQRLGEGSQRFLSDTESV